jgi:DNA-binding response OmpR family regulator
MNLDQTLADHGVDRDLEVARELGLDAKHILLVDDSRDVHLMLSSRLGTMGFELSTALGGAEALDLIADDGLPDLVLLDIMMPGMDGFQLAEEIQQVGAVPIICLSALADTETKVEAINRFADDYITKPYAFPELVARIQRVLRRAAPVADRDQLIPIDAHLSLNFRRHLAILDREQIQLTPTESRILRTLYDARGELVSPEELLTQTWDTTLREGSLASLWVHVRRLRTKIERDVKNPRYVVTKRGKGYLMPQQMAAMN